MRPSPAHQLLALEKDETFIEAAYSVLLRRKPDPTGREFFLGHLKQGSTRALVLRELISSSEYQIQGQPVVGLAEVISGIPLCAADIDVLLGRQGVAFIEGAYATILNRRVDESGLQRYLALADDPVCRLGVLKSLFNSAEFSARDVNAHDAISAIDALLARVSPATPPVADVSAALSIEALIAQEGAAFIESAYLTLLGRLADGLGKAQYLARLESGVDRMQIVQELVTSREGRQFNSRLRGLRSALTLHAARKNLFWRMFLSKSKGKSAPKSKVAKHVSNHSAPAALDGVASVPLRGGDSLSKRITVLLWDCTWCLTSNRTADPLRLREAWFCSLGVALEAEFRVVPVVFVSSIGEFKRLSQADWHALGSQFSPNSQDIQYENFSALAPLEDNGEAALVSLVGSASPASLSMRSLLTARRDHGIPTWLVINGDTTCLAEPDTQAIIRECDSVLVRVGRDCEAVQTLAHSHGNSAFEILPVLSLWPDIKRRQRVSRAANATVCLVLCETSAEIITKQGLTGAKVPGSNGAHVLVTENLCGLMPHADSTPVEPKPMAHSLNGISVDVVSLNDAWDRIASGDVSVLIALPGRTNAPHWINAAANAGVTVICDVADSNIGFNPLVSYYVGGLKAKLPSILQAETLAQYTDVADLGGTNPAVLATAPWRVTISDFAKNHTSSTADLTLPPEIKFGLFYDFRAGLCHKDNPAAESGLELLTGAGWLATNRMGILANPSRASLQVRTNAALGSEVVVKFLLITPTDRGVTPLADLENNQRVGDIPTQPQSQMYWSASEGEAARSSDGMDFASFTVPSGNVREVMQAPDVIVIGAVFYPKEQDHYWFSAISHLSEDLSSAKSRHLAAANKL